jgi:uncharacterized protein
MSAEHEDAAWLARHHKQMRWMKRLLRWMPRRANIHRYPGLKWASGMARSRMYLWSFRYREVAPALYVGTIISFLPIMGIQIPVAFIFALLLRGNLPIFVALQFISNWVTAVPIYYTCYEIGRLLLRLLGVHVDNIDMHVLREFFGNVMDKNWAVNGQLLLRIFGVTSLGGLILGSFVGTVLDQLYRLMAWRAAKIWRRVIEIRHRRMDAEAAKKKKEAERSPPTDTTGKPE